MAESNYRDCFNCGVHIPPETDHYEVENSPYCESCLDAQPYTAYCYYIDGEFIDVSEGGDDKVRFVESFDDEYEY